MNELFHSVNVMILKLTAESVSPRNFVVVKVAKNIANLLDNTELMQSECV